MIPDGRLVAYSADKGEKLLEVQTGLRGGMGPPITYELDGKQYVTVAGGTGTVRFPVPGAPAPAPTPAAPSNAPAAGGDGIHIQADATTPPPPPPGPGRGGPSAMPKMLTFVLDGNLPLPEPPK